MTAEGSESPTSVAAAAPSSRDDDDDNQVEQQSRKRRIVVDDDDDDNSDNGEKKNQTTNNDTIMDDDEDETRGGSAPTNEEGGAVVGTTMENRYATTPTSKTAPSTSSTAEKKDNNAVLFSPELLRMYYSRLFPYHLMHSWLSYEPNTSSSSSSNTTSSTLFSRREFSFTIDINDEEIYIRYRSFTNEHDLASEVLKRNPRKIDIGAIFNHPPKDKNSCQKFTTEQRELVFDIDLTDYDDVRNCGCFQAKICNKCWTAMTMAVKVMDLGLREDFGFKHIAWFYSGRRGVHAWVCDESARNLSNEGRSAVASYFEVSLGTDRNKNVSLPHPLHPMLSRAHTILEPLFIQHVLPASGQGLLATPEACTKLLQTLPQAANVVKEKLEKRWTDVKDDSTPQEKWELLKRHLSIFVGNGHNKKTPKTLSNTDKHRIELWCIETIFRHTYPRLDINVSKMQNHLLKSPFCVHPKTGRVCVPIDVKHVDEFDPFDVPTLPQLMKELDEYEKKENNSGNEEDNDSMDMDVDDDVKKEKVVGKKKESSRSSLKDWQKTSLKKPFETFQKEFLEPMLKELRRERREEIEERAAYTGDF